MKTPGREHLVAALVHVRYTIDQLLAWLLFHVREKEFASWPIEQQLILSNACIESGLLSLRILNEFFKREKTKELIKASHYMGDASPDSFLTSDEEQRINDHLAHLTWERLSNPSPPWSEELTARALERCHRFLAHVLKNLLTNEDQEHAPCTQEVEAITQYLNRRKAK